MTEQASRSRWALLAALALSATGAAGQRVELPDRDRDLRSRPAPVWAVGADEGESWELLSGVQSMAFDARDNLYALDAGNFRVLVFDAAGRFVRQFGKQGGGPGEFRYPMGLAVLKDGSIAVLDMGRRGLSLFGADGTWLRDVPLAEGLGAPRPNEMFADPAGGVLLRAMPSFDVAEITATAKQKSPVVRQPLSAGGVTVLHEFEMDPPQVTGGSTSSGRTVRMAFFGSRTFAKDPSWGPLPDGGIAISVDGDYAIRTVGAQGREGRTLTRPIPARRVTKSDQDAAREARRRELQSGGSGARVVAGGGRAQTVWVGPGGGGELSPAAIEEQLRRMEFAEEIAAIERIVTDPAGRIWVERTPARPGGPVPIDLLDAAGRYIGTLRDQKIPGAVSLSGLAAWVEPDVDTGIERIVVRRLPADWK